MCVSPEIPANGEVIQNTRHPQVSSPPGAASIPSPVKEKETFFQVEWSVPVERFPGILESASIPPAERKIIFFGSNC